MVRSDWLRIIWVLAILSAIVVVVWVGKTQAATRQEPPEPHGFIAFPIPSPTPIAGLHDYQAPSVGSPLAPAPTASPKPKKSARPKATSAAGHTSSGSGTRTIRRPHRNLSGKASWHATGRDGAYGAACRPLRRAIGPSWRGRHVLVAFKGKAIEIVLNDWCGSHDKTVDLSDEAFRYFAPLSRGVLRVTVGW